MASLAELLFDDGAAWFSIPAIAGTFGYAVRFLMAAFGGMDDGDGDGAIADGVGGGDGGSAVGHALSSWGMAMLSFQGFLTFTMGFGWAGLGAYRGSGWPAWLSAVVGVVGGIVLSALMIALMRSTRKLSASGNLTLDRFVGTEAESYTSVPAAGGGRGQISAIVGDRQRYLYAVTDGEEIPARSRIRIIRANGDNTVTVQRI